VSATPSMSTKSTRRVKLKLQERDGNNCWLCARPMPDDDRTLEHLTPLSLGGSHDLDNLVLCHFTCNRELGNVSLEKKLARKAKRQKGRCDDQY
jgi:5-methylcytosine-specific restriction protein A